MALSEFLPIAVACQAASAPDGSDRYNLGCLSLSKPAIKTEIPKGLTPLL